jgi:hypothetical protein
METASPRMPPREQHCDVVSRASVRRPAYAALSAFFAHLRVPAGASPSNTARSSRSAPVTRHAVTKPRAKAQPRRGSSRSASGVRRHGPLRASEASHNATKTYRQRSGTPREHRPGLTRARTARSLRFGRGSARSTPQHEAVFGVSPIQVVYRLRASCTKYSRALTGLRCRRGLAGSPGLRMTRDQVDDSRGHSRTFGSSARPRACHADDPESFASAGPFAAAPWAPDIVIRTTAAPGRHAKRSASQRQTRQLDPIVRVRRVTAHWPSVQPARRSRAPRASRLSAPAGGRPASHCRAGARRANAHGAKKQSSQPSSDRRDSRVDVGGWGARREQTPLVGIASPSCRAARNVPVARPQSAVE